MELCLLPLLMLLTLDITHAPNWILLMLLTLD